MLDRDASNHCSSIPQVTSAGRREQHLSFHSFLLRHGRRLGVRQRDAAFLYNPPESATESLHVPPFPFHDCDLCRLDTNYGLPFAGGSTVGWIERAQEYVRSPPGLSVCCLLTAPTRMLSQSWINVSQLNPASGSPPPNGADTETMWSAQSQSRETATELKTIATPKARLHPSTPGQLSTSTTLSDLPNP